MGQENVLTVENRSGPRRPHLVTAEMMIDGRPLLEYCSRAAKQSFDLVSPFGWTATEYQRELAERLLLRHTPELPTGRVELLVCPECAGLGCGCISAVVRLENGRYTWSELGYENDYDPDSLTIFPMGGFVIGEEALLRAMRSVVPDLRGYPETPLRGKSIGEVRMRAFRRDAMEA